MSDAMHPQLLTKAGILNVPEWYEAGKVYAQSKDAIPICEFRSVNGTAHSETVGSQPWERGEGVELRGRGGLRACGIPVSGMRD